MADRIPPTTSDSGSSPEHSPERQPDLVPPTTQELLGGLQELRQNNPKLPECNTEAALLREALKVPADSIESWVSILSEDESWLLSWEILAMDAESRSLNAANRAQELMTGYCRKLAYQQSQIVKLEGDLQAQRIEVTKRDNEITLLKDVVAKGESDLNARDAIIAKRDSTVGIEELEIADLTEREKKALEQLAAKAAEARGQEELISKIKDDADASHTAVQQQVDTNERLKSEIEAKSSVLATKEAELAAKAEVISQKDSEIKDLKVQIEKFRVEANRAKEVMDGLHKLAKKPEKK